MDYILPLRKQWLEDELRQLPYIKHLRIKYFNIDRELSDLAQLAVEASERAIKSLRKEINELTGQDQTITGSPCISYGRVQK